MESLTEVDNPYFGCMVDYPVPIFEDKTMDLLQYHEDYNSGQIARVVKAMSNEKVINKDATKSNSPSMLWLNKIPMNALELQRILSPA
eukprot:5397806-Ditylum_brightwellii.AAC.1